MLRPHPQGDKVPLTPVCEPRGDVGIAPYKRPGLSPKVWLLLMHSVSVIGGGLAGAEAAWQLGRRGVSVKLYEMRPERSSPAHTGDALAELVCSNSLGADRATSPAGILKEELRLLESIIIRTAERTRVPAGGALAVDRESFSRLVTEAVEACPNVELIRREVTTIPDGPVIIAAGPLLSGELAERVKEIVGEDYLSFFDAVAPVVTFDSIDMSRAFRAGRYGQSDDYINCPMDMEQYRAFREALVSAERVPLNEVDFRGEWTCEPKGAKQRYFEGCLPVEVMAERGADTLRFGPMRPVGLPDPASGREPCAVLQLRRDNADGTLYNMVGFQTNLKWGEQERVFRMIPALESAEFVRKGVMHRNTFVNAPRVLDSHMRPSVNGVPVRSDLFLAGQITGVEGYVESTASGMAAALNMYALLSGMELPEFPAVTAIGSLFNYLSTAESETFQPMNVNLGIFPKLETVRVPGKSKKLTKQERSLLYAERSMESLELCIERYGLNPRE